MNAKYQCGAVILAAFLGLSCQPGTKSGRGFHLSSGNAENGKAAFVQLKCTTCHTVNGVDLPPPAVRKMHVELGGLVVRARTYGELVTAIIEPSRDLTLHGPDALGPISKESPMTKMNHEITVEQLTDIVTFLEEHYWTMPLSGEQPVAI